jgi:hypothetical protein
MLAAVPRAGGGIGRRARLRALWTEWSVEVRVLFGALEKPRSRGAFLLSGANFQPPRWLLWSRIDLLLQDQGADARAVRLSRLPRPPDQSPRVREPTRRPTRTRTPRGQRPSGRGSDVRDAGPRVATRQGPLASSRRWRRSNHLARVAQGRPARCRHAPHAAVRAARGESHPVRAHRWSPEDLARCRPTASTSRTIRCGRTRRGRFRENVSTVTRSEWCEMHHLGSRPVIGNRRASLTARCRGEDRRQAETLSLQLMIDDVVMPDG